MVESFWGEDPDAGDDEGEDEELERTPGEAAVSDTQGEPGRA